MSITIKNSKVTKQTIKSEIDFLTDVKASQETKAKIRREVGDYLLEQTLLSVGGAKSPIEGEKFPALSKSYKKYKVSQGRPGVPNLELKGDMLDALETRPTSSGVEIGIFDNKSEAGKADGHNDFTGTSNLPQRRFLPQKGQNYKTGIKTEVNNIITDILAEESPITRGQVSQIKSKIELWARLKTIYPEFSRSEIKGAVSRSQKLSSLLNEFNLLGFL